jgi:hypothetical protein
MFKCCRRRRVCSFVIIPRFELQKFSHFLSSQGLSSRSWFICYDSQVRITEVALFIFCHKDLSYRSLFIGDHTKIWPNRGLFILLSSRAFSYIGFYHLKVLTTGVCSLIFIPRKFELHKVIHLLCIIPWLKPKKFVFCFYPKDLSHKVCSFVIIPKFDLGKFQIFFHHNI